MIINFRFLNSSKLHKCGNFRVQYPHCTQKVNAICAKIGICVRIFHICTIHKIRCRCHRSRQTHRIVTYVYKYIRSLSIIEKPAKPIGSIEATVSTSIVHTCSCLQLCSTVLHILIQQIQLDSLCINKMDILLRLRVSIMKMNCELLSLAVFFRKFDNDSQYLTTRNLATFVNT